MDWRDVQDYADAKTVVIEEILTGTSKPLSPHPAA
jgi:hypothetical protein